MKLLTVLIFLGTLTVSANVYSQRAKITLDLHDSTSLKDIFGLIEKSSEFIFIYDGNKIDSDAKRFIQPKGENINLVLDQLFKGINLAYIIDDRQIFIYPKDDPKALDQIMSNFIKEYPQQQRTISGTVRGEDNSLLAGATVQIKGTIVGTLTDVNGKFTLSVPTTVKTITVSFVGMESKEVAIDNNTVYDVVLFQSKIELEEFVVIGYGTQKKMSVVGAITSVSTADLVRSPSASISNSLSGLVTGVTSLQYSGQPGADESILFVRGVGSLTESASRPLVLVDGVERPFTQLDPNEIESIAILKDASATAVYGIRGANGVIIVTTRRGLEGAPLISFSASTGVQRPIGLPLNSDGYEYATRYNQAKLEDNPSASLPFSNAAIAAFKAQRDGTATLAQKLIYPNSDWVGTVIRPMAMQAQENINISGGNSILKYFVSFGHIYQDGLMNTFEDQNPYNTYNFNYKRYNYRGNVDLDMTKSTRISLTIGGRNELRQRPGGWGNVSDMWDGIYIAVPFSGQVYDGKKIVNGNRYIAITNKPYGGNYYQAGVVNDLTTVMNLDIGVSQKLDFITEGLSWRFKVANNTTAGQSKSRTSSTASYDPWYLCDADPTKLGDSTVVFRMSGSDGIKSYSESSSKSRNWYLETALSYERQFGDHRLTGLLLYNENKIFYPGSYSDIAMAYVGLAARGTYSYKLKYMGEFNLGYNGSENFAPGNRFGLFPSIAIGWVLTEENFMKNKISILDYLKFRATYGISGNDVAGSRFIYIPTSYNANAGGYSFGTDVTTLQYYATEGKLGNPDVTWEKARKQNYGLDLKMFKGKLGVTADFFYENRSNILASRNTVPFLVSISLPVMNIGKMHNQGYEIELKWLDNFGKVNYNIAGSVTYSHNTILFMDEPPKAEPYLVQTGLSVGQPFGYVLDGFWTADEVAHYTDFPNASYVPKPGDSRWKDLNSDGIINSSDQKAIGYPDRPEYNFTLRGGLSYKGFDLNTIWNGATHTSRIISFQFRTPFENIGQYSLFKYIADNAWTPETAATATLPRITFSGVGNNNKLSDLYIKDASYIRLKNVEIGYSFSNPALKRLGVSKVRVSASGYDILTFSKLNKVMDPEMYFSDRVYPLVQIYNLGLNITF